MERWRGKVVVVTGASSGIGEATASTLAKNGMIVVGLARRIEKIEKLASETEGILHPMKCDLTNKEEILKVFRQIEEKYGGVDVLINNAGYSGLTGLSEGSIEKWQRMIDTNVMSLSICTKEALKTMRQRGDNGHIIHINSVGGHRIYPISNLGMYNASKHAVTVLTEMLRNELREKKSKIKVSSVSPGLVYTPMGVELVKDTFNQELTLQKDEDLPPALYSQDMADLIVFMLSVKPYVEIQELMVESTGKAV